ncbi:hypothetical protein [Vibrio sp. TRT 17S01]|uniref:hypothetical protein n=1 Tax=Vibrio sp. TRT 17S01 TaxID=3418505 RepID=UPI003CECD6BB
MAHTFVRFFWLILLVMALPAQALSYLQKSEADASYRLSYLVLKAKEQSNESPTTTASTKSKPQTHSEPKEKAVAIINSNRWGEPPRSIDDHDDSLNSDADNPFDSLPLYRQYYYPVHDFKGWTGAYFYHNHRLSGWKETNALYVALNSQY